MSTHNFKFIIEIINFLLNNSSSESYFYKLKIQFKNLNFYSIPHSILYIVRKRLNLVFSIICFIFFVLFSLI